MRIALYQPDIPQNVGAAMRLCACLGLPLDIIEPCGFPWDERKIRRAAMDYIEHLTLNRHSSWEAFTGNNDGKRLVLLTTQGAVPYTSVRFEEGDILLAGRESAGVPEAIHRAVDARIVIPMADGVRSLNVVNALSMVAGEALRQVRAI